MVKCCTLLSNSRRCPRTPGGSSTTAHIGPTSGRVGIDACEFGRRQSQAFVERGLNEAAFARITRRDDVFALLEELATFSFSGRRYLKLVNDGLAHDDDQRERRSIVIVLGATCCLAASRSIFSRIRIYRC